MEVAIGWLILGALFGAVAAERKGWNLAVGILAGALLGILAPLLFFLSGITGGDPANVKCPFCAEMIKAEARICKHCGKPVGRKRKTAR